MKRILLFLLCLGISFAAHAEMVPVTNFSFEEPDTESYTATEPPADVVTGLSFSGWNITQWTTKYVGLVEVLLYIPTELQGVDGNQTAYCDNSGQFTSNVITTTQANMTYTMTVALGNRDNDDRSAGDYLIELLVDDETAVSKFIDGQTITRGTFVDLSAKFGSADSGGELKIRLTHTQPGSVFRQGIFDNVRLEAKRALAFNPDPPDGAQHVDVDTDLSWILVEGATCDVYFGTDPNILDNEMVIENQVRDSYDPDTMQRETRYYWRVDGIEPNELGTGYIVYPGDTWTFTTEPEYPVIVGISPEYFLAELGETAEFVIDAWDPLDGTLSYQWYKVDPAGDIPVGDDLPTLTIEDTQFEDEGTYYCVVSNASPKTATSDTALLTIKQLIGWWKFADVNDLSGYGNDATVYGAVAAEDGTALEFDGNNDTVSIPVAVFERMVPTQISFTLWQYGHGNPYSNNRIFEATPTWLGVHLPWDGYIYWDASDRIYKAADLTDYTGQWQHWVFTKNTDADTMKIYLNGTLWHSGPGKSVIGDIEAFSIGSSADATWGFYDGMIKDFRIYNYEIPDTIIAQIYFETSGIPTCIEPPDYDFDGDCLVNLADLAIAAENYLRCGLYPASECP
jgi:hypothetical protein